MLDQIKIASPCSADWERMEGTDRVRFCAECKKNVFNLSAIFQSRDLRERSVPTLPE